MQPPNYPIIDAEEAKRLGLANIDPSPRTSTPTLPEIYPAGMRFPREKLVGLKDVTKTPLVLVACGSFSPVTYLHMRMFEMAVDYISSSTNYELIGAYFSPVSDAYNKPGLARWDQRVDMCNLAVVGNPLVMVDGWEASQPTFIRTAQVLDHFDTHLNHDGGLACSCTIRTENSEYVACFGVSQKVESLATCTRCTAGSVRIKVHLLAGGDLIQSFAIPNLWSEWDLDHILGEFGCIIIERMDSDVYDFLLQNDHLFRNRKSVFVVKQSIHNDISSTKIRLFVRRGMSIRYLVNEGVDAYIRKNGLYLM